MVKAAMQENPNPSEETTNIGAISRGARIAQKSAEQLANLHIKMRGPCYFP
jgi:hypothetical protein